MKPCTPAALSPVGTFRLDELERSNARLWRVVLSALVAALLVAGGRVVDRHYDEVRAMNGPAARTAAITVNNTTNTQLRDSSTSTHQFGICTVETSGLNVFLVESTASDTSNGEGPYCDTCNNGPRFIIGGKDYARTSASSGTVRCRFYDAPLGAMDVGGGLSMGLADSRYVNANGDTMTGGLTFSGVATDITTGTDQDLTLSPNGTGIVVMGKRISPATAASCNAISMGTSSSGIAIDTSTGTTQICVGSNAFVAATATTTTVGFPGTTTTLAATTQGTQVTTGTPLTWRTPTAIAASGITLPTCSTSADAGKIFYVDDSDDANSGAWCGCRANSAGTYANVMLHDNTTACPDP
jgi:hypothetical protein